MAGSVNKVILVGNLGKDPEVRYAQSGSKVVTFSIATSESWQDKTTNERRDITQWHRIVVFNENLADIIEKYVKKGSKVYIEGSLQYRKYTDPNGIERHITEVILTRFRGELHILDSKPDKTDNSQSGPKSSEQTNINNSNSSDLANDLDDDIPF